MPSSNPENKNINNTGWNGASNASIALPQTGVQAPFCHQKNTVPSPLCNLTETEVLASFIPDKTDKLFNLIETGHSATSYQPSETGHSATSYQPSEIGILDDELMSKADYYQCSYIPGDEEHFEFEFIETLELLEHGNSVQDSINPNLSFGNQFSSAIQGN